MKDTIRSRLQNALQAEDLCAIRREKKGALYKARPFAFFR